MQEHVREKQMKRKYLKNLENEIRKRKQLRGAIAVSVTRHTPSVWLRSYCACCLQCSCLLRHVTRKLWETLREGRRCVQSSVAPRRCAERSELLHHFHIDDVVVWVGGGYFCSVVLICKGNEARALRERTATFCGEPFFGGVEASLLECIVRKSLQRSTDLCVVVVVSHDIEANDRWLHCLGVRGVYNVDVSRVGRRSVSRCESADCYSESVIRKC